MPARPLIAARVTPEIKAQIEAAARREFLTESVWLRRLVQVALQREPAPSAEAEISENPRAQGARLSIRLPADDRLLLQERSTARGMAAATYISVLTRSHLRQLTPLPRAELLALRVAVSELGAVGRNLNQIARAANQGSRTLGVKPEDLRALLKVCEGLRDYVKKLINANTRSWSQGHA